MEDSGLDFDLTGASSGVLIGGTARDAYGGTVPFVTATNMQAEVEHDLAAYAHEVVVRVADEAGVDVTAVKVQVCSGMGASAAAHATGGPVITIGSDLLAGPPKWLDSVVAHELGHLVHRDNGLWLAAVFWGMILLITTPIALAVSATPARATGLGLCWAVILGVLWDSRRRERRADDFAAAHGHGHGLAEYLANRTPRTRLRRVLAALDVFSSHPANSRRLRRAQNFAAKGTLGRQRPPFRGQIASGTAVGGPDTAP